MPLDIQRSLAPAKPLTSGGFTSGNWSWLAKQAYDPQAAWQQASSTTRRGTLTGGPSLSRFLDMGNEQQWTVIKPTPPITRPILQDEQEFYKRQFGALDWNSIDPYANVDQVADQMGMLFGEDKNPLEFTRGAEQFLNSKGVDIFGTGEAGAPVRAADYALAFPIAVFNKISGQNILSSVPGSEGDPTDVYQRFHADPRYWDAISTGTPQELDTYARELVGRYTDPNANQYMVSQIRAQFDIDRNAMLGLSSGNESVDYKAYKVAPMVLKQLQRDGIEAVASTRGWTTPFGVGVGLVKLPFGSQMASFVDPATEDEKAAWLELPSALRRKILSDYGGVQMATEFINTLPLFSGLGTVLNIAKAGGTASAALYKTYDWSMRAAGWTMSAGLAAAATNWALEASWPGYSEFLGEAVDRARPISKSYLAGAVNTLGYWASGTYGAYGIAKVATRVTKTGAKLAAAGADIAGLPHPSIGLPEMVFYQDHFGGGPMSRAMVNVGLEEQGLKLSQQHLAMSYAQKVAAGHEVGMWDSITRGDPTGTWIDDLPSEERAVLASDALRGTTASRTHVAEMMFRILNLARQEDGLFQSEAARSKKAWAVAQARTIEHEIANAYEVDYGPAWVIRTTGGAFNEQSMREWSLAAAERLGLDPVKLQGSVKGEKRWLQAMRTIYHYEFDLRNGELAAAEASGGTTEAGRLSLVSQRHLFDDSAEEALAALRSEDPAAQAAMIQHIVRDTIEGQRWFDTEYQARKGMERSLANIEAEQLAQHIEDIRPALMTRRNLPALDNAAGDLPLNAFHTKLHDDGLWELAFKPVDENGEFVSYVRTRSGAAFQTSWMDYPMSSGEQIELGNRGLVGSKMDGIFRGFRTHRVTEFQRASLYRSLSSRFAFTPGQIEDFHAGILQIARDHGMQAQTVGALPVGLAGTGTAVADRTAALVKRVFGEGPYEARDGTRINVDWPKEIARSYRQSLRLNFTAGLTSQLKSRFGPVGRTAAYTSDVWYINLRFNLSPLFKLGEVEESMQLNVMRGVNPRGDPWTEALMSTAGIGNDYGPLSQELSTDQMLLGAQGAQSGVTQTTEMRQAASYIWHARNLPKTFDAQIARQALQARADEVANRIVGNLYGDNRPSPQAVFPDRRGQLEYRLAEITDAEGNILAGHDDEAIEISRILDGTLTDAEVRLSNHVGTELPNEEWSLDPLELGDGERAEGLRIKDKVDPNGEVFPEERGLWHATTNVDGVHESGLMSRLERIQRGDMATGLGSRAIDKRVSLTHDYHQAEVIAARVRLASAAAHDTATARDILDHFLPMYDDIYGEARALELVENIVMSTAIDVDRGVSVTREVFPDGSIRHFTPDELEQIIDGNFTGKGKYEVVQLLDRRLDPFDGANGFSDSNPVHFAGEWEDMLKVDPTKVGVVQIGVKKGARWYDGPDANEIQLESGDIWTMDQRILDQPLSDDREGLLRAIAKTTREDGTPIPSMKAYRDSAIAKLAAIDAANIPPQASRIEDVFGTPEHMTSLLEVEREAAIPGWRQKLAEEARSKAGRAWGTFRNPIPFKQHQATLLEIDLMKRGFRNLLEASGNDGVIEVMRTLNIPETEWAPFLVRDRELVAEFHATGDPAALQRLIEHSGPDARGRFDELYASEDWHALTAMWALASRTAADTAFGVHFFNPYRSAFERSINHPLLGAYPASWAYKVAREWALFLFDNRTFGGGALRLGMSPAVALNQITRSQNETFAQGNDEEWGQYIGRDGPLGSTFFVFNLLLPGDWSDIPFPLSRTLRDSLRGQMDVNRLADNMSRIGLFRDIRYATEMLGEAEDMVWGPEQDDPNKPWRPAKDRPTLKTSTLADAPSR